MTIEERDKALQEELKKLRTWWNGRCPHSEKHKKKFECNKCWVIYLIEELREGENEKISGIEL